jgi:hypothetical protein
MRFTFGKQQAGLQAANYRCISLTGAVGGTMAGAAAGSAVPIVGNVAGAAIAGRYCWWLHWQALPLICMRQTSIVRSLNTLKAI